MSDLSLRPDLYRRNGFRVTGLPVDASARVIRRRRREIDLGVQRDAGSRLPPETPPTPTDVNDAFARLEDPRTRIMDELTWLWTPSDGRPPDGVDTTTAQAHDGAVFAHCRALDLEHRGGELTEGERAERDRAWTAAMRGWREVATDEDVWRHLRRRRAEIDDARLSGHDVERLRTGLPDALLAVSAALAVGQAAEDTSAPARHRRFMAELAGTDAVDRAMREAASGLVRDVDEALTTVRGGSGGAADARRLVERVRPPMATLRSLVSAGDPSVRRLGDAIASEIRKIAATTVNRVRNAPSGVPDLDRIASVARTSTTLLETALTFAVGATERAGIESDLVVCRGILDLTARFGARPATTPARSDRYTRPGTYPGPSAPARSPGPPAQPRPAPPPRVPAGVPAGRYRRARGAGFRFWLFWAFVGAMFATLTAAGRVWGTPAVEVTGLAAAGVMLVAGAAAAHASSHPPRGRALTALAGAAVLVLMLAPYPTLGAIGLTGVAGFLYAPGARVPAGARSWSLSFVGVAGLLVSLLWAGSTWFGAASVVVFVSGLVADAIRNGNEEGGVLAGGVIGVLSLSAWLWWGGGVPFLIAGLLVLVVGGFTMSEFVPFSPVPRVLVFLTLGIAGIVTGIGLGAWWLWVPGGLVALLALFSGGPRAAV